jgi:hypothetical protein
MLMKEEDILIHKIRTIEERKGKGRVKYRKNDVQGPGVEKESHKRIFFLNPIRSVKLQCNFNHNHVANGKLGKRIYK